MTRIFVTQLLLLTFCLCNINAESFNWAVKVGIYNNAMCVDKSDNIYTTGTVPVIKYNSSGQETMRINAGANDSVTGYGIAVDGDGNIYLSGIFSSQISFGSGFSGFSAISNGYTDVFWAKFRADGTPVWLKIGGGKGYDGCNAMDVDAFGNIYILGSFSTSATFGAYTISGPDYQDLFVLNCDSNGTIKWIQTINGIGNKDDYLSGYAIAAAFPGTCIVTGDFGGTAVFAGTKYTSTGIYSDGFTALLTGFAKTAWVKIYPNAEIHGMKRNKSGDIFTCGGFSDSTDIGNIHLEAAAGVGKMLLIRYDSSGNPKWAEAAGTYCSASSITIDSSDHIYVAGSFSTAGTSATTAQVGNTYLTSHGEADGLYAKFDEYGNKEWALGFGATGEDFGNFPCLNKAEDRLVVYGDIQFGTVKLDGISLSSTGSNEFGFIADLTDINTGIPEFEFKNADLDVYPNPAPGSFNISTENGFQPNSSICVYNDLGKEILTAIPIYNQKSIHFDNVPAGIYTVAVRYKNGVSEKKIVIQK